MSNVVGVEATTKSRKEVHIMSAKEIAKDILLKALEQNYIIRDEFPKAETAVDAICEAYKKILKSVRED